VTAHHGAETGDLDAILAALHLPRRARARWLADLESFCRGHGGERVYRDLHALIAECRARSG
jgi:hypothetical protein